MAVGQNCLRSFFVTHFIVWIMGFMWSQLLVLHSRAEFLISNITCLVCTEALTFTGRSSKENVGGFRCYIGHNGHLFSQLYVRVNVWLGLPGSSGWQAGCFRGLECSPPPPPPVIHHVVTKLCKRRIGNWARQEVWKCVRVISVLYTGASGHRLVMSGLDCRQCRQNENRWMFLTGIWFQMGSLTLMCSSSRGNCSTGLVISLNS